jgi:hypothetical protein
MADDDVPTESDDERQRREREFSRREMLRMGMAVPAVLSAGAILAACGGGDDHTDTAHVDTNATTTPAHGDSGASGHGDSGHGDSGHADQAHNDHHDNPHGDVAHTDAAHGDLHHDGEHNDGSSGYLNTTPHQDCSNCEGDNGIIYQHLDAPAHADSHGDSGPPDSHTDTAHSDTPHTDIAHGDAR